MINLIFAIFLILFYKNFHKLFMGRSPSFIHCWCWKHNFANSSGFKLKISKKKHEKSVYCTIKEIVRDKTQNQNVQYSPLERIMQNKNP
jgi:hypothetical protein